MSDRPIDLNRQVLAHLQALKAAGVLFIPRGPELSLPPAPSGVLPEPASEKQPTRLAEAASAPAEPKMTASQSPTSLFAEAAPAVPGTLAERRRALEVLMREVEGCDLCGELYSTRTQTVFGTGPMGAEVAFVGEAPGADEDRTGVPFVGKAGQLLTRIINRCGFRREDVYIFNILKCRPPNNRQPHASECTNCRSYFERQFDLIQPKYVVALGAIAAKNLLQTSTGIGLLRGKFFEYRGRPLLCTYHPSALLRDETRTKWWECWEDMKSLLRKMGRPVPEDSRG